MNEDRWSWYYFQWWRQRYHKLSEYSVTAEEALSVTRTMSAVYYSKFLMAVPGRLEWLVQLGEQTENLNAHLVELPKTTGRELF